MTPAHRIRRLRWRVRAGTQAEAFAVRLRLRQMHDETGLIGELERAFDATGIGSEVVHIPRLALTLRVTDLDHIGPALAAGVYREIEEWRASRPAAVEASARGDGTRRAESVPASGVEALVSYLQTGMLPWPLANAGRDHIFARLTDAASRDPDRILAHVPASLERAVPFLFRWLQLVPEVEWIQIARRAERASPAGALSGLEVAIRSLGAGSMSTVARVGRERLLEALRALERRGDPSDANAIAILSRILSTFPHQPDRGKPHRTIGGADRSSGETRHAASAREDVTALQWSDIASRIEQAVPGGQLSDLADAIRSLGRARVPAMSAHARQSLTSTLLALAIKSGGRPEAPASPGRIDAGDAEAVVSTIVSALAPGTGQFDRAAALDRLPAAAAAFVRNMLPPIADRIDTTAGTRSAAPFMPAQSAFPARAFDRLEDDRESARDRAEAFGVAVEHAGLVLLHPFLPRLFEQTGVLRAGETSLAVDRRPRAAALLSFASRGVDEPIEFELGFIKVLLGLRPDTDLLVSAGLLAPGDGEEVDALLQSVIEHWKVLRHTSIAGLRGSFLQRPGLVADIDGFWRLRVEPKPFDVLLDQLPWAISTVKLPWMTVPLFTEWMTP